MTNKSREERTEIRNGKDRNMGKITVETCGIEGLKVITPTVFGDARGYFMETYNYNDFKEAGIDQVQKRRAAGAAFPDSVSAG